MEPTVVKPKRKYVRKATTLLNMPKRGRGRPPKATKQEVATSPYVEDILAILGLVTYIIAKGK